MEPIYHYCLGGAGVILHKGNQAIWETATMEAMVRYLRENGIRDKAEYRPFTIAIIR